MRHLIFIIGVIIGLVSFNVCSIAGNSVDFESSVVKIFASVSIPNVSAPWQKSQMGNRTGSGAVISGNRILTSAHVVSYATFIEVKKSDSNKHYQARVEAIGNDCDLAILTVTDSTFFDGVPGLSLGPVPDLQDAVLVVGFPKGGEELSVTKGIVSRIDVVPYSHSGVPFMAVQIDAAINSGNSGGPVIQNNQLVGVAFQSLGRADSIGYMVPEPIIKHFLEDLKDGKYDGFPYVGFTTNKSVNPFFRARYGLKDHDGGVVLNYVTPEIVSKGLLYEGDVVLSLDGVAVGSDGTVPFRKNSRLPMWYLIDSKQVGESINFEVLRNNKKINIKMSMVQNKGLVKDRNFYEKPPYSPYYIYGGAVFAVLTDDLLDLASEADEIDISNLLYYRDGPGRFEEGDRKDIVVLLYVLPDEVNVGYHDLRLEVVSEVNGKKINALTDLVLAIESNQKDVDVIRTEDKTELVFNRRIVKAAEPRILSNYKIPAAYSEDIRNQINGPRRNF